MTAKEALERIRKVNERLSKIASGELRPRVIVQSHDGGVRISAKIVLEESKLMPNEN